MFDPRQVRLTVASGLLALVVLLSGCTSSDSTTTDSTTTADPTTTADQVTNDQPTTTRAPTTQAPVTEAPTSSEDSSVGQLPVPGMLAAEGTRTNWSGTINDDIEFSMWLAQQGRFLRGEITYSSVGEPITVLGTQNPANELYVLREFGPDGRVSGTMSFSVTATGGAIGGLWFGTNSELELRAELDGVDDDLAYYFDPLVRSGDYAYSYPPFSDDDQCCGPIGNLTLIDLGDGTASIGFENNRGGPSFNQALFGPTAVTLTGNRVRFDGPADGIYDDCGFEITVFDGFAFVEHVDERFNCGFGNAAGIEGAYLLID